MAVLAGRVNGQRPTQIQLFPSGAETGEAIPLPAGSTAHTLAGTEGALYLGGAEADLRGVLYAVTQAGDTRTLATLVSADDLARIHGTTMTPSRIALDEINQRLLTGAIMKPNASSTTPGVVAFDLVSRSEAALPGRTLLDRRRGEADLLPWQADVIAVDAEGRVYVDGLQRCNEFAVRPTGVFRIEHIGADPNDARLVRPWISGVRTVEIDPVNGHTWLGLRDENPGLACDGYNVQTSVCRLKADGSCEIYAPPALSPDDQMPPLLSAMGIAFGNPDNREMAIATWRNATFLRIGDQVGTLHTQMDPGVSLEMTAAAWGSNGLWLASQAMWDPGVPNDGIDWAKVNDRSPHGLGYVEFDENGRPALLRRYSRNQSDQRDYDLAGMPSNNAQDVLPLHGRRHALVALGAERERTTWDHIPPEANGIPGGIVVVNDTGITPIEPPDGAAWTNVIDLAEGPDKTYYALDTSLGVVTIDIDANEAELFVAPAWGATVQPTSLAVDADGLVAVGTTAGLWVYGPSGAVTRVIADRPHGTFWTMRFTEPGVLYAGADQGLVRVALDDAESLPASLGPVGALPRTLWPLEIRCDGEDGCLCVSERDCAPGSTCACSETGCACAAPQERCDLTPGDVDCTCTADEDCLTTLRCTSGLAGSTCQPDDANACLRTCDCPGEVDGCPSGTLCQGGITGQSCAPEGSCLQGCGCDGGDGCPATWHCDALFYAGRCIADFDRCLADCSCEPTPCPSGYVCDSSDGTPGCTIDPAACLQDCSCGGDTGCPDGYECQGGFAGFSCVEVTPPSCEDDCSCTGGNPDGCPTGMECVSDGTSSTCVTAADPCLDDCTCTGTADGCLPGYHCQGGFAGFDCVQD